MRIRIIIFTSDHGEALGDHGLVYKGCRFYEGSVRVPLMISWQNEFLQDVQSDALVELLDIVPTLYDALGVDIPYYVQGKSLAAPVTRRCALLTNIERQCVVNFSMQSQCLTRPMRQCIATDAGNSLSTIRREFVNSTTLTTTLGNTTISQTMPIIKPSSGN